MLQVKESESIITSLSLSEVWRGKKERKKEEEEESSPLSLGN
jgi:hypothetical protein